jgi:hypothetical protein
MYINYLRGGPLAPLGSTPAKGASCTPTHLDLIIAFPKINDQQEKSTTTTTTTTT